jgi:hypothetical protein
MKKLLTSVAVATAFFAFSAGAAFADSIGPITFESSTYALGNINGQNGWSMTGGYDVAVDSSLSTPGFGSQSLRISNAVTSGSFGDQTFSPALTNPAGESTADNASFTGTIQPHFESQFQIFAIPNSIGDMLSVSPDRGDGSRMSYLRFDNESDGIHVYFDDVTDPTHALNADSFNESQIALLSSGVSHTVKFTIDFYSGQDNDVVNIYIDGSLVHTGTSWEDYYRFDSESNPSAPSDYTRTVRTMLFRESGTAVPANSGKGFLVDNLSLESGSIPLTPSVTTNAANPIGTMTATLNGTDGPAAADNTSFWWGTTSIGPLTSGSDPGSSEFPSTNWSHDSGEGAVSAGGTIAEPITGLTPNTTYYFVAWVEIGGTWYPGQVLSFTTSNGPVPSVTTNSATGETTTSATLNGTDGPVSSDQDSFWWGTTVPTVPVTTSGPDPASTGEWPGGDWQHDSGLTGVSGGQTFSEAVTGLTPGATYYYIAWVKSGGIWYPGQVLTLVVPMSAVSCPANTAPSFLETDLVDSSSATPIASSALTSGQQYLITASGTWSNSSLNVADAAFSSLNSWTTYQEGYDTSPYLLGPNEFQLQVNGGFVNWGPYDGTNHTYSYLYTGTGSTINLGVFDGDSNSNTANAGWYGDNSGKLSVSIYSCLPTTGSLTIVKDAIGGDSTFNFTSTIPGRTSFAIPTTGGTGSQTFSNLTPGTYNVTETNIPKGWTMTDTDCTSVTVTAGDNSTTCTITNTNNKLLGEIRGTKFVDRDGDGTLKDGDHHRLAGVTINLAKSSAPSTIIASTVTDKLGNYRFLSLPAGTYIVSEVVQSGWKETYPASGTYSINLAAGKISKNDNFGNFKMGSISGVDFNDANDNGHKDSGEVGLAGWTTVTDSNGNYSFSNLAGGVYTLTETLQSGWTATAQPPHVVIISGTNSTNDNFGNTQHPKSRLGNWWNRSF